MVDGSHDTRMPVRELVGDLGGSVARPVVDGDDLERLGNPGQRREGLVDETLEIRLLVVGRKEVRKPCHQGRR
jgi:hypothetical protein